MVIQETSNRINKKYINNIKGISSCFECESQNIQYYEDRDEITCRTCGLVIREQYKDHTPYKTIKPEPLKDYNYHEQLTNNKKQYATLKE